MKSVYEEKGKRLLKKSFCAYLDILGFSQKIIKNDLDFFNIYLKELGRVMAYLKKEHYFSPKHKLKSFELKIFTDNFVFGYPWEDEFGEWELGQIFDILSFIQFQFAKKGIYIRGAVTVSPLFMDNDIVLGPALLEAYELESKHAAYPRIILSKEVSDIVKEHIGYYAPHNSPQSTQYLIDVDGYCFINYLYTLYDFETPTKQKVTRELRLHKEAIIHNLHENRANYKVLEKYIWIAKYHNFFVNNFAIVNTPKLDTTTLLVAEELYTLNIKKV